MKNTKPKIKRLTMEEMPYITGAKIRIFPNYVHKRIISKSDGAQRFVYNRLTGYNNECYQLKKLPIRTKVITDRIDYLSFVVSSRKNLVNSAPFLNDPEIDSMAVDNAIKNYHQAWKNCKTVPGTSVPKFHKKQYEKSYNTNAHYYNTNKLITDCNVHIDESGKFITLPKLRKVRFKDSGRLKKLMERTCETRIGTITVHMNSVDEYYVSFQIGSVKPFHKQPKQKLSCKREKGYDLNIENLFTDSDGNVTKNLKLKKKEEKYLAKHQRKMSRRAQQAKKDNRKLHDSKNYQKERIKVAKTNLRIKRQRETYYHKITKKEIENQDILYFENLKVKNMLKNHCLANAISDVSWSTLLRQFEYKAKIYGKTIVKVPPKNTTQTCSECGYILTNDETLTLNDRKWICPRCRTHHNRDHNSAKNIKKKGQDILKAS